jgi:hypothetical protein
MPTDADSALLPGYATLTEGSEERGVPKKSHAMRTFLVAELVSKTNRRMRSRTKWIC